jgi:hypothetical protein
MHLAEGIDSLADLPIHSPSFDVPGTDSSAGAIHDIDVRHITTNWAGIIVRQKLMCVGPLRKRKKIILEYDCQKEQNQI